jgi:hypothetical protein
MPENEHIIEDPYAPPGRPDGPFADAVPGAVLEVDRGTSLMKMGIIGAVFLGMFPIVSIILGAIGWSRSRRDLEMMALGRMSMEHGARAKTKAGFVLGKINVMVAPFALVSLILYIWFLIETGF